MSGEQKILQAYWESGQSGLIVLARDWVSRKEKPPLFFGPPKRPFESLERCPPLVYARIAGYLRFRGNLLFSCELPERGKTALAEKGVFVAGDFNDWQPLKDGPTWRMQRTRLSGITFAALPIPRELLDRGEPFAFKFQAGDGEWLDVPRGAPNAVFDPDGACNYEFHPERTGLHLFNFSVPDDYEVDGQEEVLWSSGDAEEIRHLPPTTDFLSLASDSPLGAESDGKTTRFRLFAPRADKVVVEISEDATMESPETIELEGPVDGVWKASVPRDLGGFFYHYRVHGVNRDGSTQFHPDLPVLDPYAKAAVSRGGPGILFGPATFPPGGIDTGFSPPQWDDLVVCECHVRDLLARLPASFRDEERLGFAGLARWIRTGRSYLHELGVNAVELQPIQEFDSRSRDEYHWGYMPVNYFSPESTYGAKPELGSQVEEFRDLVRALHEQEFTVILDVVYNHIGEPNNLLFLDKYYYFHLDTHHTMTNWSGCGNDLRTDAPMVRRLIVESLLHLVEQYGVDGFRFDLADLVGKPALQEIEQKLKEKHPHLVLITEPWSFRGHLARDLTDTAFSQWNDGFRDFVAEYVRGGANQDAARYFLAGSPGDRASWPAQTVNYSESHDDYCWLDRITENPDHEGIAPTPADRRRTHLMAAFLFCSVGIPMISAGQDGLRTKHGVHNTYQRGDLNAIDYERRTYYTATVEYFARWIRLRLAPTGRLLRPSAHRDGYFRFSGAENTSAIAALYNADGSEGDDRLLFAINPHPHPVMLPWPKTSRERHWIQVADQERVAQGGLEGALHRTSQEGIYLPALSCGLWKSSR